MWIGHRQFQKEKARYLSAKLLIGNYLFRSIYYLISHLISRFSTCRIPYRRTSSRVQWRQNSWEKKAAPTLCCETDHLSLHPTVGPWGRPSSHQASCAVVPHHLPKGTNSLDKILTMWTCCWPEVLTGVIETRKLLMEDIMKVNWLIPKWEKETTTTTKPLQSLKNWEVLLISMLLKCQNLHVPTPADSITHNWLQFFFEFWQVNTFTLQKSIYLCSVYVKCSSVTLM